MMTHQRQSNQRAMVMLVRILIVLVMLMMNGVEVDAFSTASPFHHKSFTSTIIETSLQSTTIRTRTAIHHYPCHQNLYGLSTSSSRHEKQLAKLYASTGGGDPDRASVRLSSSESATTTSTLDGILTWIISDIGSIVLGCVGLILLLLGRLILFDDNGTTTTDTTINALEEETRFNLLATLACCAVLVNGLSKLDVTTALAETVQLVGQRVTEPMVQEDEEDNHQNLFSWLLQATVVATPAETAVLLKDISNTNEQGNHWQVAGYVGTVPFDDSKPGLGMMPQGGTPILDRFLSSPTKTQKQQSSEESYLPTLQALPGRTEFVSYLPANTQAVLLLPLRGDESGGWVLALGANQARGFTPRDIAWCQAAVQRVGQSI